MRDEPTSVDRILDAAHAAFAESGVGATTMTRIARDAGVSREWLYRQFANRDAVNAALNCVKRIVAKVGSRAGAVRIWEQELSHGSPRS